MAKKRIWKKYRTRKKGGQHYNVGKKRKKYSRGPKPKQLTKEKVFHTIFVQEKKTGLLKGRKSVPGAGDRTPIRRDTKTGRIFGRFEPIKK